MVARDYSPSSNAGLFIVAAIRSREGGHARAGNDLSHRRGIPKAAPTGPAVAQCVATPGLFHFAHDAGDDPSKASPSVVSQLAHGPQHAIGASPCRAKLSGEMRQCR